MTLIQQRHSYDCTVAALAMFLGKTYEEAEAILGHPTAGMPLNETYRCLLELGEDVQYRQGVKPTKPAMVVVFSKNQPGKLHMIYFDGEKVWDPSPNLRYETVEEMWDGCTGLIERERPWE